jgi:general secretion pathway protein D
MTTHPAPMRSRAVTLATTLALTFGPGGLLPMGLAMAATKRVTASSAPVTLNFVNADIEGVARAVSAIVHRQIMVDPRVKGTVTLYSEQPISAHDAYLNFLSALRGQGFALIEVAGILKVVPEADAKLQTGVVEVGNKGTRTGDQVLTQIFKLQYENVNSMVTVLRPLISPNNTINANPSTNSLVITDYADNLTRIGQIIAAMDNPATTDLETIPLQYAVASDLAPVVQKLSDSGAVGAAGGGGGGQILVVAEPRSNSLMVRAPNGARLMMVKNLIQKLDRPGSNGIGGSGINVVYLKNADAVKLAQILRAAFPSGSGGGSSGGGSSATPASTGMPSGSTAGAASGTATGASTQSTTPVSGSAGPSTGGYIQADPASNSLIITAPDALYKQLRSVIDQLDGRRAQVYIETMIVEVNAEKFAQVGVQWQTILGKPGDANLVGVGTNLPAGTISGILSSPVATSTATAAAVQATAAKASGFNIGVVHDFGNGAYGLTALASFLQTKADGNILSTPNLMVLDNEEAKIVSGENVPFVTGSFSSNSSSTSGNPFTTVERKDVGLTLRVKPQVGEGGTIRMTVYQEKSDVKAGTEDKTNGPTTSKSSIETTVVVDDGTLLVLGGLIKEQASINRTQVPLLGDAPLIGQLFRSETRTKNKTNLMVFLRPVVMRTREATNAFTLGRYEYMQQEQRDIAQPKRLLLPTSLDVMPSLSISNGMAVPSVRQPLDDPKAAEPNVMLPPGTAYSPRMSPSMDSSVSQPVPAQPGVTSQPLPAATSGKKSN